MNTKFYTLALALLITIHLFAQAPQKMSYQAVIRNSSNALVTSSIIGMRISILQTSASGTVVYTEAQNDFTNANGLINIEIGGGSALSGSFTAINWAAGPYFIKTETDPTGGTNYTISSVTQLLSVPYALYAKTAENLINQLTLSIGQSYQGGIIFWLDATGQHGLIAATTDQSTGLAYDNIPTALSGATGDGLYSGIMNTSVIIATEIAHNQTTSFAALICADYSVTVNGVTYGDWYLPSKYEVNLLYAQRAIIGGFSSGTYWSSTEYNGGGAWYLAFSNDNWRSDPKSTICNVRAIRAF